MTDRGSRCTCSDDLASRTFRRVPVRQTIWGSASSSRRACSSAAERGWYLKISPEGGAHVAIYWNRANLEMVEKLRPTAAAAPHALHPPELSRGRRQRQDHGD